MRTMGSSASEISGTTTVVHSSGQHTLQEALSQQTPTSATESWFGASKLLPVPQSSVAAKLAEVIAQKPWDELLGADTVSSARNILWDAHPLEEIESIAPWAEVVPGAPYPMTVDDLARLPDDGYRYELVQGRLVRMPLAGGGHGIIAAILCAELTVHVRRYRLGYVHAAETGFRLAGLGDPKKNIYGADVSFVRANRAPPKDSPEWVKQWPLAPDLIAEVASPKQKMAVKARNWLQAGVQLVWVIWPERQQIDVWRPGHDEPVQTLKIGDALDGLDVVPGFSYPLQELFEV